MEHYFLSDQELAKRIANCTLNPELFTHEAHLRLAYHHIASFGLRKAEENLCEDIRTYATAMGDADKYHETVTVAAVKMVDHFMRKSKKSSFREFIQEYPRLRTHFRELLDQHYGFNIFKDERARQQYVAPDLLAFS